MVKNFLVTLAAAVAGGLLFYSVHSPLPWMLGPLTAVIVLGRVAPARVCWPVKLRNAGLMVLGHIMGRPFTAAVGLYILSQIHLMLGMTVVLILASVAAGYITHRQTGLSLATCVLATVPGGLSQMVVLGEEIAGADATVVTVMQTIRMLSAVFTVPFLVTHGLSAGGAAGPAAAAVPAVADPAAALPYIAAVVVGALLAARLGFPTPYLLGPVLATAPLVVAGFPPPVVPQPLLNAAQIAVGAYMGSAIDFAGSGKWRKILAYTFANVAVLLVVSLLIGYGLAAAIPTSGATAFLSAAPGGMAEMGLTAILVGGDVSVVVGYHMFRLLFILIILPPLLRRWLGEGRNP
ncbi:AbrB family transcriptional regulator [Anaeroselena agilis]|uniref:AbrB family transcriptional regulator n=1 Tax=Anaeroselena agilis TaxID=3063788 RepID=A0ABU3P3Z7_9FIRM|nr:AbrB family transcriptional regulator [Selenomonadales bacterium 4137-cl]